MTSLDKPELNGDFTSKLETAFHSFQSTRDDVNTLKAGFLVVQRDMLSLTSTIEKLVARFEESRKTNWPAFALLAGLLPIIIGGFAFFVSSYTTSAIAPVHTELVQTQSALKNLSDAVRDIGGTQNSRTKDLSLLAQTSTANSEIINRITLNQRAMEEKVTQSQAADVQSRTDRGQLNERLKKMEDALAHEIADRKSQNAQTKVQLSEVEQQFHSVSNLENLRAAQQERLNAMLWEKSHPGERYPNSTFFPTSLFQGPGGSTPINPGN